MTLSHDAVNLQKPSEVKLENQNLFDAITEVEFNIVLFQAVGYEGVEQNEKVKDAINESGKVYISGTKWKGQGALRIAVCNHLTPRKAATEALQILDILENIVVKL